MSERIRGVDVSRWQGLINWPILSKNVSFAIIKLGGSDQGFYPDGQAVRNVLEARAVGLPIGFYVYLGGANDPANEVIHIKNLVSNIGGLRPGEPFVLDWEENHSNETGYVYAIAKGLIDAGFPPPIIYMSESRVNGADWSRLVGLDCALWCAKWGNNDAIPDAQPSVRHWPGWAMWQFSSTGNVPGVSGRVDLNLFNGSVKQFKDYGGTRKVTMPSPVNSGRAVFPAGLADYSVQPGDNLSSIAARFGKSWQELFAINRDRVSQPNRIFTGQKLRVWSSLNPAPPKATPIESSKPKQKIHTVENGENLSVIASRYGLSNWTMLWEANRDVISDPNLIYPGMRLRIP